MKNKRKYILALKITGIFISGFFLIACSPIKPEARGVFSYPLSNQLTGPISGKTYTLMFPTDGNNSVYKLDNDIAIVSSDRTKVYVYQIKENAPILIKELDSKSKIISIINLENSIWVVDQDNLTNILNPEQKINLPSSVEDDLDHTTDKNVQVLSLNNNEFVLATGINLYYIKLKNNNLNTTSTVKLNSSVDEMLTSNNKIFTADYKSSTISEYSTQKWEQTQVAGNSISSFITTNKDLILTSNPRISSIMGFTSDPFATRFESPVDSEPKDLAYNPSNEEVYISYPVTNQVVSYTVNQGYPVTKTKIGTIRNVYSLNYLNNDLILVGTNDNKTETIMEVIPVNV